MNSKYFFDLNAIKPENNNSGGKIIHVTSAEAAGLVNISFSALRLEKLGSLEPIWHPNANKIGYVIQGKGVVAIRNPSTQELFTVKKGDIFFVPQGYVHHIVNNGDEELTIKFALSADRPETMRFSQAIESISDSVFNSTFKTPNGFVDGLKKGKNHGLLKTLSNVKNLPDCMSSRYKFNIGDSAKPILTKGGYLQIGTKINLPALSGLGILGFGLNKKGIVEPHWHTNAGELVYIVKGETKITVLSPDGKVDLLTVKAGQGAFAPASYFHNIENVGSEDVEVIAFFSNADPDYIGIGEVMGSYSNEVLASIFNVDPSYFDGFKKPQGPLVIVPID